MATEEKSISGKMLVDFDEPLEIQFTTSLDCPKFDSSTEVILKNTVNLLEPEDSSWGKSLSNLPSFTIKEVEDHRKNSGKTPNTAIIKTLDRGRKSKNERYLSTDTIYTKWDYKTFVIKGTCKSSMKKDLRNVKVSLDISTGKVSNAQCTCPAGNSGYCNHVMALLLEIADYSLN